VIFLVHVQQLSTPYVRIIKIIGDYHFTDGGLA